MTVSPLSIEPYAAAIKALPPVEPLQEHNLRIRRFRHDWVDDVQIYYAPLDYVNENARLTVVGITPSWAVMEMAYSQARRDLRDGRSFEDVCRRALQRAAFGSRKRADPTRTNLVSMLAAVGIPSALGSRSSADLFERRPELAHWTSVIRYPTFVKDDGYSGTRPDMLTHPTLRRYVDDTLASEVQQTPDALFVPLGTKVNAVFRHLEREGVVSASQVLWGMPHPSPGNGRRQQQFAERQPLLTEAVSEWFARR